MSNQLCLYCEEASYAGGFVKDKNGDYVPIIAHDPACTKDQRTGR